MSVVKNYEKKREKLINFELEIMNLFVYLAGDLIVEVLEFYTMHLENKSHRIDAMFMALDDWDCKTEPLRGYING